MPSTEAAPSRLRTRRVFTRPDPRLPPGLSMKRLLCFVLVAFSATAFAREEGRQGAGAQEEGDLHRARQVAGRRRHAQEGEARDRPDAAVRPVPPGRRGAGGRPSAASRSRPEEDHRADPGPETETPDLLFRLGELYWEESKFYFFEANRKDDDKITAMNRNDKAGIEQAEAGEGGADQGVEGVRPAGHRPVLDHRAEVQELRAHRRGPLLPRPEPDGDGRRRRRSSPTSA